MDDTATKLLRAYESAKPFRDCLSLLRGSLEVAPSLGLHLEFGVWSGVTISHIATFTPGTVYGFDSFFGLPEDWNETNRAGRFDTAGKPPEHLPSNVELVIGLFDETLPGFLQKHQGPVSFVHVDCDLYSSTKTVLTALADRFVEGSVLNFNEFWCYPEATLHEFKAFSEFLQEFAWEVEPVGRAGTTYTQAAFKLKRSCK